MPFALLVVLAAAPVKVASPTWNVVDIKPELAKFYAEQMAQALRNEGFQVTTADDIQTLLGAEREKQLLGCSTGSNSCMAELANALGCDATLTVNLARLGNSFRGLVKLMSSSDGSVLSAVKLDANTESQLSDRIDSAAKELAKPFREKLAGLTPQPKKVEPVVIAKPAGPTRVAPTGWWIPGAAGVVAGAIGGTLLGLSAGKWNDLNDYQSNASASLGRTWVTEGTVMQVLGFPLVGLGVAAITGSLLWLALGSTEVQPQVTLLSGGAALGVGGRF